MIARTSGCESGFPAGYSALEESIEPETDSTYARYTMYVLDGEWEFNIDALQDVFDPEAKNIADLSDYCASRDSAYYDGGIIKASRPLVSNGTDMLYSEGRRTDIRDSYSRPTTSNRGSRSSPSASATPRRNTARRVPSDASKNCSEALS